MDQDELTHECTNVTPQDETSASNIRPRRKATPSTRAKEMYQTSREEHCRKLDSVWKNVESAVQALSRAKGEQFTGAKTHLRASYECYERATARYSAFLEKAKTFEARHELQLQQAIDEDREAIVSEKLREATPQERDKAHKTASQFSLSVHSRASSRSRRSGFSTISLAAVQARAHAEAAKARAQFGRKEAAMRLEKARIEAELEVLQHEKEAAAADAQASALEAAVEQDGGECVRPHPPLDRTLRVSSYITEQAAIRDAELASLRAPVIHPRKQSLEHAKCTFGLEFQLLLVMLISGTVHLFLEFIECLLVSQALLLQRLLQLLNVFRYSWRNLSWIMQQGPPGLTAMTVAVEWSDAAVVFPLCSGDGVKCRCSNCRSVKDST
ncbi:hypothetical protein HPB51_017992 [Rhipicephalus microplus]|uniref:Uncharacterized protein n=1 Tax=Rhipicephalus microplus TaxID=6941 RepID=A0A9J6D5Y9_RHIMP|nr:hypothetical protein HPB51_017992 [Rhipicephalus microplus]